MYINYVDELLEDLLDITYDTILKSKKLLSISDINKHQQDINEFINRDINTDELKKVSRDEKFIKYVTNLIKKYKIYYLFTYIGLSKHLKEDEFISIVTRYTNNQKDNKSINNFFNNESTKVIIDLYKKSKCYQDNLEKKSNKCYEDLMSELSSFNDNYKKIKDLTMKHHYILRIIIIYTQYFNQDKRTVEEIINNINLEKNKSMYIEIVIRKSGQLLLTDVEQIFPDDKHHISDIFFNMIRNQKTKRLDELDVIRSKIYDMYKHNFMALIIDDFLMYHKDDYKYKVEIGNYNKKETSLFKFIVDKIDNISNIYSEQKKPAKFYEPLKHRNAILVNYKDNASIINKLKYTKIEADKEVYYSDLIEYNNSSYANFKTLEKMSLELELNKTLNVYRDVSFRYDNNIQYRSTSGIVNITGLVVNKHRDFFMCETSIFECNNKYTTIHVTNDNVDTIIKQIDKNNDLVCIIFDKISYENILFLLNDIYDYFIVNIHNHIENAIKKMDVYNGKLFIDNYYLPTNNYYNKLFQKLLKKTSNIKIDSSSVIKFNKTKLLTNNNTKYTKPKCFHHIVWKRIINDRDKLNNFIKQYSTKNNDNEYICNICSELLVYDVSVQDGKFVTTETSSTFQSTSSDFFNDITTSNKYAKYSSSISLLGKIIEKLASMNNVSSIDKTLYTDRIPFTVKWKSNNIMQQVLDVNNLINNKYSSDLDKYIVSKYKIVSNISDFVSFNMDNQSIKLLNKNKQQKSVIMNIIFSYCILFILLDLTDNHIVHLKTTKLCNIDQFNKTGIFDNIVIRENKSNYIVPITKYKTLCYVLYVFACNLTTNNTWNYTESEKQSKKHPIIMRMIVMTLMHILGYILELAKSNPLCKEISENFYSKLNTTYNDTSIIAKTKKIEKTEKIEHKTITIPMGSINQETYNFKRVTDYRKKIPVKTTKNANVFKNISDLTNCIDGQFHQWTYNKDIKQPVCDVCNIKHSQVKNDKDNKDNQNKDNKEIQKIITIQQLNTISHTLFKKGIISKKDHDKSIDNYEELMKIQKIYKSLKPNIQKYVIKINEKLVKEVEKIDYKKVDTGKFISTLSKFKYPNIDNTDLYHDIYIVNHSYTGSDKEKVFIKNINNLFSVEDNKYFNMKVIIYNESTSRKMYYNKDTLLYLGYKETNKDYVKKDNTNNYLGIIYSISNQLINMGHVYMYNKTYVKKEQFHIRKLVNKKKMINDFMYYLYFMTNNNEISEDNNLNEIYIKLYETYNGKLKINTKELFENWLEIYDIIKHKNIKLKEKNNLLMNYIVSEFVILLDNNKDNNYLPRYILEFIIMSFNKFRYDEFLNKKENKRYIHTLNTSPFFIDIMSKKITEINPEDIIVDKLTKDQDLEAIETKDALDMEYDLNDEDNVDFETDN